MKKAFCSFLSICLLMPFLLFPKSIQANENEVIFEFESDVWDSTEDNTLIPHDESWYLSEHADVHGFVYFPSIHDLDYEIVGIETNRPDSFQSLHVEDKLFLAGSKGVGVNFHGIMLKDEYFTLTVTLKKGDETLSFTSQPHIYKQKSLDVHICAGPDKLTSMTEIFDQPEANEFKLNQMYYIYVTIDGYTQYQLNTSYNVYVNNQVLRYMDVHESDEAVYYGFYDVKYLRSAGGPSITTIAFKAYKDVAIDVAFQSASVFNDTVVSSNPTTIKKHYEFSNAKDMEDETGNVEVSAGAGVLPSDASLQVKEYKDEALLNAMKEVADKFQAYDISISSNGQSVQPNGTVKVRVKIPEGFKKEFVNAYYVDKEGNLTLLKSKIDGEYIEFETNHFSVYAIVEEKQNDSEIILPPAEVGGGEDTSTPSTDKDDPMKNTDMQESIFPMGIIIATMMMSACAIYLLHKKVKE